MDFKTTIRLTPEQLSALEQAEREYDRSQSYLVRKAIDIIFVHKLIDINNLPEVTA